MNKINCSIFHRIGSVVFAGLLGVSACTSAPAATAAIVEPTNSVPPTPALELAANYVKGSSAVPSGMYLFLELSEYERCSEECHCPAVEPPKWAYELSSSGVCIENEDVYKELFPAADTATPLLGLLAAGQWDERLFAITALPFTEYYVPLYAIASDGAVVIGIQGREYLLNPGQTWVESGTRNNAPPAGCRVSYVNKLINHGLLQRSQIQLCP